MIHKLYAMDPATYILKDLKNVVLKGRFYEDELQKVIKSNRVFWRVEKVLKTRGSGPNKEFYVKWKGFDEQFNSWVKESWMKS